MKGWGSINRVNGEADPISRLIFPDQELDRLRDFFQTLANHKDEDYLYKRMSSFFSLSIVQDLDEFKKGILFQGVINILHQNDNPEVLKIKWIELTLTEDIKTKEK